MQTLLQDMRYGIRILLKAPGFTAVAVLTLALGIGVNTAVFSFVDRLLLRRLPFPESERLASIYFRTARDTSIYESVSYPDYVYYRDSNDVFSGLAAYAETGGYFRFKDHTETISGEIVSANYFSVLGVSVRFGRTFLAEEDIVTARNPVLILGNEVWQQRFSGDPSIVGRQIIVNGASFSVVGIAPPGFRGFRMDRNAKPQFWVPTMMYSTLLRFAAGQDLEHYRGNQWLSIIGRLKGGVTFPQAEANISNLTERLKQTEWRSVWKETAGPMEYISFLTPANSAQVSPGLRQNMATFLGMLMAVVRLVLLIACSNVAGLVLARAVRRQKEIGLRLALGAGRTRLFQQLLTESLLLSLMGGAAGLVVAWLTSEFLANFEQPFNMQLLLEADLDARVLVYGMALSVVTGFLFGLVPLSHAFRVELITILKADSDRIKHYRFGMRDVFVIVQVTLSLVLLVGAGLFVRTLRNAQATDVTCNPENVLLMNVDLAERKYDDARGKRFYSELSERLHLLPGVQNVALVYVVPMGGRRGGTDIIPSGVNKGVQVDFNVVSEEYFQMIGLPILHGRGFNSRDREGTSAVSVINEQMARRFWPGEDPVGKQFRLRQSPQPIQVVGIVRDGRFQNYRANVNPCLYLPLAQYYESQMNLEIRTAMEPMHLIGPVRKEIYALDKDMPIKSIQTLRAYRDRGLGREQLSASLLGGFGFLATVLAAIGLYGILSFSVAQRTREIGLRVALGATSGKVIGSVVGQALGLIAIGLCGGLLVALLLTRFVSSMLFGVTPTDALTYALTAASLIVVGLLAAYVPARRAASINPIEALRHE